MNWSDISDSVLEKSCCTIESLILLLNFPPINHLLYSLHGSWKVIYDTSVSVCVCGHFPHYWCHPCPKYLRGCLVMWLAAMSQRPVSYNTPLHCSFVCRFVLLIFFHDNKRMFYHVAWNKLTEIFIWKVTCVHVLADFYFFFRLLSQVNIVQGKRYPWFLSTKWTI